MLQQPQPRTLLKALIVIVVMSCGLIFGTTWKVEKVQPGFVILQDEQKSEAKYKMKVDKNDATAGWINVGANQMQMVRFQRGRFKYAAEEEEQFMLKSYTCRVEEWNKVHTDHLPHSELHAKWMKTNISRKARVFPESTVYCGRRIGAKYISITKEIDDIPEPPVALRDRVTVIPQHYFTVCLATIYGPEPKFLQIVDFIEHHKLQGATFFHIYLRNSTAYDRMLLDDYVRSGEIELIVLNDQYWRADFMWHMMQINECHMRNVNFAKWTALLDIDERLEMNNGLRVVDYLDSINNPNVVNLHFGVQWVLKDQLSPAKFENDTQFVDNLVFKRYHNTSRVDHWLQPKCIIRPDKIGAMTIHAPLMVYHGFLKTYVNSTIGVVRHYRNVRGGALYKNNERAFDMGPYQLTSINPEMEKKLTKACLSRVKQVYDTVQYSCEEMQKMYAVHLIEHPCIKEPGYLPAQNITNY
uniref:Glycosyltransferase family 92 protein n=1 Tax=Caenorhabditis japonica TaxID=281687 RepID=A0A8R1DPU9_CAEJA